MRMEESRPEVLDLCHHRPRKQDCRRRVRACGGRLKTVNRERSASGSSARGAFIVDVQPNI